MFSSALKFGPKSVPFRARNPRKAPTVKKWDCAATDLSPKPPKCPTLALSRMARVFAHLRQVLWLALDHDVFNTAKAAAYSGMLCFFPTLLVLTALLAQVPEGTTLVGEVRSSFEQFLPPDSMS